MAGTTDKACCSLALINLRTTGEIAVSDSAVKI